MVSVPAGWVCAVGGAGGRAMPRVGARQSRDQGCYQGFHGSEGGCESVFRCRECLAPTCRCGYVAVARCAGGMGLCCWWSCWWSWRSCGMPGVGARHSCDQGRYQGFHGSEGGCESIDRCRECLAPTCGHDHLMASRTSILPVTAAEMRAVRYSCRRRIVS